MSTDYFFKRWSQIFLTRSVALRVLHLMVLTNVLYYYLSPIIVQGGCLTYFQWRFAGFLQVLPHYCSLKLSSINVGKIIEQWHQISLKTGCISLLSSALLAWFLHYLSSRTNWQKGLTMRRPMHQLLELAGALVLSSGCKPIFCLFYIQAMPCAFILLAPNLHKTPSVKGKVA